MLPEQVIREASDIDLEDMLANTAAVSATAMSRLQQSYLIKHWQIKRAGIRRPYLDVVYYGAERQPPRNNLSHLFTENIYA